MVGQNPNPRRCFNFTFIATILVSTISSCIAESNRSAVFIPREQNNLLKRKRVRAANPRLQVYQRTSNLDYNFIDGEKEPQRMFRQCLDNFDCADIIGQICTQNDDSDQYNKYCRCPNDKPKLYNEQCVPTSESTVAICKHNNDCPQKAEPLIRCINEQCVCKPPLKLNHNNRCVQEPKQPAYHHAPDEKPPRDKSWLSPTYTLLTIFFALVGITAIIKYMCKDDNEWLARLNNRFRSSSNSYLLSTLDTQLNGEVRNKRNTSSSDTIVIYPKPPPQQQTSSSTTNNINKNPNVQTSSVFQVNLNTHHPLVAQMVQKYNVVPSFHQRHEEQGDTGQAEQTAAFHKLLQETTSFDSEDTSTFNVGIMRRGYDIDVPVHSKLRSPIRNNNNNNNNDSMPLTLFEEPGEYQIPFTKLHSPLFGSLIATKTSSRTEEIVHIEQIDRKVQYENDLFETLTQESTTNNNPKTSLNNNNESTASAQKEVTTGIPFVRKSSRRYQEICTAVNELQFEPVRATQQLETTTTTTTMVRSKTSLIACANTNATLNNVVTSITPASPSIPTASMMANALSLPGEDLYEKCRALSRLRSTNNAPTTTDTSEKLPPGEPNQNVDSKNNLESANTFVETTYLRDSSDEECCEDGEGDFYQTAPDREISSI